MNSDQNWNVTAWRHSSDTNHFVATTLRLQASLLYSVKIAASNYSPLGESPTSHLNEELFFSQTETNDLFFLMDEDMIQNEPLQEEQEQTASYYDSQQQNFSSSAPINIPQKQQQSVPPDWYMSPPSGINPHQLHADSYYSPTMLSPTSMSPTSPASPMFHPPGTFSPTQHYEGTFACVCGKRYASLTALKNHAKLHTNRERNFICATCKKVWHL